MQKFDQSLDSRTTHTVRPSWLGWQSRRADSVARATRGIKNLLALLFEFEL